MAIADLPLAQSGRPDADPAWHDRRIVVGLWAAILFAVVLAVVSLVSARALVRSLGDVAFENTSDLSTTQALRDTVTAAGREARGYLLSGDPAHVARMAAVRETFGADARQARATLDSPEELTRLAQIERTAGAYWAALDRLVAMRRGGASAADVAVAFEVDVQPARDEVNQAFADLVTVQQARLHDASKGAAATVSRALGLLVAAAAFAVLLALALGVQLTKSLRVLRGKREEAERQVAKLERLNHELDAFAGRVAHDIRNLLSPLALAAGLLPREIDRAEKVRALAARIQRGIDRALALMGGLLAFARSGEPDTGVSCSVAAVVDDTLDQLAPVARHAEVQLTRDVEDGEVACSREMLTVVVLNVVGNALKYMTGCEHRRLVVGARAVAGFCELSIADTGVGIPEAALAHIFEPFYRVPGNERPGAGIGLATVARVVDAHGGRVAIESKVGVGTTIRIALPLACAAPEQDPASSRDLLEAPVSSTSRRMRGGSDRSSAA